MLHVDFMHSDLLGVGGWLLATALYEMAVEGAFGHFLGQWKVRLNIALFHAYQRFDDYCKQNGIMHSQTTFSVNLLSMSSNQDWPSFKGKAHNVAVALDWLAVFVKQRPSANNYGKMRDTALRAHKRYHEVMHAAGPRFTQAEARSFFKHGMLFLQAYSLLARHAQNHGVPHWCIKPKHHHLWHGFEQARLTGHNPKSFWLFKHEDFVGIATRIGRLAHPASISRSTLLHWSMKADASKPVKRKPQCQTRHRRRIKRRNH